MVNEFFSISSAISHLPEISLYLSVLIISSFNFFCKRLYNLGLSTSINGTKLIRKCIYNIINSNNDFYILEDIFQEIILNYPELNSKQIRSEIGYALSSRNERLSKKNFEKVFGYEYDSFIFTPKNFIDEIVSIIF